MFKENKSSIKKQTLAVLISTMLLFQPLVAAGLKLESSSSSGHAYSDTARNGVPIINIAKPNGGVSRNKYINFNVSTQGLILNNANTDVKTKLGGYIYGNINVKDAQANTILNEVTGSSRSHINGYIEVAGKRADVIVVNPRGITVNGGGFINTPKATFDAKGSDVTITGKGLDASTTSSMTLKGGKLNVNAKIHGKSVSLQAGSGGIDSSALGGIYANVITLKSSSSGVGVNLVGDILAQSKLSIDSKGDIVLNKAVSKGSATLNSSRGDIEIKKGMHARDLTLDAKDVKLKGNTGASRNLTIRSTNLVNNTVLAAGVNPDFSEASGGVLTLTIANSVTNNDTLFGKSGIKITANTLTNAKSAVILTNNLETNIANDITNDGEVFTDGTTSIAAGNVENNGSIHSGGALNLSADNDINNNEGTIESLGTSDIVAGGDILSNKGIIYSQEAASMESTNFIAVDSTTIIEGDATLTVSKTTDIQSSYVQSDNLNINTQDLVATSVEITSFGDMTLTTDTIAADSSNIVSTNNIDVTASTSFSNDNTATLYAEGNIAISTGELSHTKSSLIQSGGDTTIEASNINNTKSTITATNYSSTGNTLINNEGMIYAKEKVSADTQILESQNGLIQADGSTTLTATTSLDNTQGEIYANDALSIIGGDVINDEGIIVSSEGKTTIFANNIQSNDSTISGAGVEINVANITADRSTIESSDTLSITATSDVSMDETKLYASSDTTLSAGRDVSLNDAIVYSQTGKAEVSSSSLYAERLLLSGETSATVITEQNSNLDGAEVTATGDVTLSNGDAISLNKANVYSTQNSVTVSSDSLQANETTLTANTTLDVTVTNDLTAQNSAFVSNDVLSVSGGDSNIDESTLYSQTSSVALSTKNLSAQNTLISGDTSTTVRAQGDANLDGAEVAATGEVSIQSDGLTSLHNASVYSLEERVTLQSGTVEGNGTRLSAGNKLDIRADGSTRLTNSELIAIDTIEVNTGDTILDGSTLYSQTSSVALTTTNLSAQNTLISAELSTMITTEQDSNLDGAEVAATGAVTISSGGDTSLNDTSVYSVEESVTLQSGSIEGNGTLLSAAKHLQIDVGNSVTLTNAEFVAADSININAGDTTLDGSVLYSENGKIILQTNELSVIDAYIETNNTISLQASGHTGLSSTTIQGRTLDIDVTGDIVANDATLLSDEILDITANSLTHSNGYIASEGAMRLTLADFLTQANGSNIQSFDTLDVSTKDYTTSGDSLLYGANGVEIVASGTINHTDGSRILSDGTLNIVANTMNQTDALTYGATRNTVTTETYSSNNAVMLGEGNITTTTFNNSGSFASDSSTLNINASSAINNQGLLSVNGDLNLNTQTLNNSNGEIESGGDLVLTSDTLNLNSARIFATNNLTLTSKLTGMNSSSQILSGGGMDLTFKGDTNTHGEIIANASAEQTTSIKVEGNLNNNAKINTGANLLLEANSVTNTNRIQSGGDMQATLNGSLNNSHFFTSGGNMDVTVASITNSGGLASADTMTLRTGSITNTETIYSGRDMNLLVSGSLSNTKEIYSGGTLFMGANEAGAKSSSISNVNGTVESYDDMYLNANNIVNKGSASLSYTQSWISTLTGETLTEADILAWVRASDTNSDVALMSDEELKAYLYTRSEVDIAGNFNIQEQWKKYGDEKFVGVNGYLESFNLLAKVVELYGSEPHKIGSSGFGDDDEEEVLGPFIVAESQVTGSASVSPAYIISGGNMYFNAGSILNKDATISSGRDMVINASSVQNTPSTIEVENYVYLTQVGWRFIDNSFTTNDDTAVSVHSLGPILSGTISRIEAVSQILVGGRLSGNVGNFQNGGQSITPTAPSTDTSTSQTNESQDSVSGNTYLSSINDVTKRSLSAVGLRENGGELTESRTGTDPKGQSRKNQDAEAREMPDQILTEKLNVTPTIYNPQDNLSLPNNPYGVFVTSSNPNGPLIEFNPEYVNYNPYVSSDYLLDHLGFSGDSVTRRLGDGLYETQLVRNAMMVMTGQRYASDAKSDMALYVNLMDGGIKLANEVGLRLGVAPTAAQLSRATEDFVWLVLQNIGGHSVLVPKVFLVKSYDRPAGGYIHAKDGIDLEVAGMLYNSGTIKTDGSMTLKTGTLINEWGTLEAAKSLSVDSVSDIANLSGTIKGGSVSLVSRTGSIYNITQSGRTTYGTNGNTLTRTTIGQTATISGDRVSLNADKDIISVGADLTSRGSMSLNAGGDIGVYTIANENSYSSQSEDGFVKGQSIEHIQSNITAGAKLDMKAGGDITLQAANITSNGANISAGGKLNVLAAYNVDSLERSVTYKDSLGDESESQTDIERTVLSTTLNTGDTTLSAGESILL